jgi:hypothetical protein
VEGHIRVPVFLPPSKETTFIVVLSRVRALVFIGSLSERRTTCAAAAQGLQRVSLRSGGALCSTGKLRMPEDSTRRARRGIHLRADVGVPQVRNPGLPPLLRAPHSCQRDESCILDTAAPASDTEATLNPGRAQLESTTFPSVTVPYN